MAHPLPDPLVKLIAQRFRVLCELVCGGVQRQHQELESIFQPAA